MDYNLYQAEDFTSDESFIAYYLQTDEEAIIFWSNWISCHPEKLDEVLNAERLLAALNLRLNEEELQDVFNRFDDFLDGQSILEADTEKREIYKPLENAGTFSERSVPFYKTKQMLVYCIFLFSCLGGWYFFQQYASEPAIQYVTKHNAYGRVTTLWLSDGTKVSLNSNSTLKYPKVFSRHKREVQLSGEALFEVAKDKTKPFTVNASGTKTTVLGTVFNISAYPAQTDIRIALLEGRVEVEAGAKVDKLILQPAEMATFNTLQASLTKSSFEKSEVTAWLSGVLIFKNASFKDIAAQFQHLYGITLKNESADRNWNYTGQFIKTDYLTVVKSICFAKNLQFKEVNHTIVFK